MSDGVKPDQGSTAFERLDPKLTVFALANGMDLAKGDGYRRLEWYTEGLERAIVVRAAGDAACRVTVRSWKTGNAEKFTEASIAESVPSDQVTALLEGAIEQANRLSAPAE